VLVCVHFVVVLASTVTLLLIVVHCALSLSRVLSLSLTDALSLSHGCSLSHTDALSLSRGCSLSLCLSLADALSLCLSLTDALSVSHTRMLSLSLTNALSLTNPLSLSIRWFVVVFMLVIFSSLPMASIWIDGAVVALRSFRPDLLVLLFVHASGFVHNSFIHSNVL
jgi:hypothetical protein